MVRNTTYAYSKPNARYNQLSVKLLNRKKGVGGILRQGWYHIAPKNQLHENQPYLEKRRENTPITINGARIIGGDKIDGQ